MRVEDSVEKPPAAYDHLDWLKIPVRLGSGEDHQPISKKQLKIWPLVLSAKQIPWRVQHNSQNLRELVVPASFFIEACNELRQFERENHNWPPPQIVAEKTENTVVTIWILILLALFHNLTIHHYNPFGPLPIDWFEAGNADADKILSGQWWRIVTALTLHSGTLHLTSNILFGGLIITRIAQLLRSGPAWFIVLLSGALGNLGNAIVHGHQHRSIGFSTAVFAALAILAVSTMSLHRTQLWRRWPLPLMAGSALLGLLGTSGEQTDLGAHLFGFLSGGVCAYISLKLHLPVSISKRLNSLLALAAFIMVAGSWVAALYHSPR